ncbi:MAG: metalloregulator ArsR/SmtB family transcription factor [Cyanobacteria bacterium P01_F01_bin.150]
MGGLIISNNTAENCCPDCTPFERDDPENTLSQPLDLEDTELNNEIASLCKALGHPARVQILKILIARQSCICGEIVDVMPLAQSTVSEHLRILKKAGLVQGDVDGTRICYCVEPRMLNRLKTLIQLL